MDRKEETEDADGMANMSVKVEKEFKPYVCMVCGNSFSSMSGLNTHIKKHHKKFECSVCGQSFSHASGLTRHREVHKDKKRWVCDYCGKSCDSAHRLMVHKKTHSTDKPFMCEYCCKSYKDKHILQRHIATKHGVNALPCSYCAKVFISKTQQAKHEIECVEKQNAKLCEFCGIELPNQRAEINHLKLEHKLEKKYHRNETKRNNYQAYKKVCDIPANTENTNERQLGTDVTNTQIKTEKMEEVVLNGTTENLTAGLLNQDPLNMTSYEGRKYCFITKEYLRSNANRFECTECGVVFVKLATLTSHHVEKHNKRTYIEGKHTMEGDDDPDQPFPCLFCENRYKDLKHVNEHRRKAHPGLSLADLSFTCGLCSFVCLSPFRLKLHQLQVHGIIKEPYKCQICPNAKSYSCHLFMEKHMASKHNMAFVKNVGDYGCDICDKKYPTEKALKAHRIRAHIEEVGKYPCIYCDRKFLNAGDLTCHVTRTHSVEGDRPYECDTCNKTFTTVKSYRQHCSKAHQVNSSKYVTSQSEPQSCAFCDKVFVSSTALQRHMTIHVNKAMCVRCNRCFKTPAALRRHIETHEGEAPIMCPSCGATMPDDNNLHWHMAAVHGIREIFTCDTCQRKFYSEMSYSMHVKTHSAPDVAFACNICGKRFRSEWYAKFHLRTHTGEKPFKCNLCGKAFGWRHGLALHMRAHSGDKRFKCQICGKSFLLKNHLKAHLNSHMGARPFKCGMCQRRFTFSHALRVHERQHTQMKPYTCKICNSNFVNYGCMAYHLKRNHGKKVTKQYYQYVPLKKTKWTSHFSLDPEAAMGDVGIEDDVDMRGMADDVVDHEIRVRRAVHEEGFPKLGAGDSLAHVVTQTGGVVLMPELLARSVGQSSSILTGLGGITLDDEGEDGDPRGEAGGGEGAGSGRPREYGEVTIVDKEFAEIERKAGDELQVSRAVMSVQLKKSHQNHREDPAMMYTDPNTNITYEIVTAGKHDDDNAAVSDGQLEETIEEMPADGLEADGLTLEAVPDDEQIVLEAEAQHYQVTEVTEEPSEYAATGSGLIAESLAAGAQPERDQLVTDPTWDPDSTTDQTVCQPQVTGDQLAANAEVVTDDELVNREGGQPPIELVEVDVSRAAAAAVTQLPEDGAGGGGVEIVEVSDLAAAADDGLMLAYETEDGQFVLDDGQSYSVSTVHPAGGGSDEEFYYQVVDEAGQNIGTAEVSSSNELRVEYPGENQLQPEDAISLQDAVDQLVNIKQEVVIEEVDEQAFLTAHKLNTAEFQPPKVKNQKDSKRGVKKNVVSENEVFVKFVGWNNSKNKTDDGESNKDNLETSDKDLEQIYYQVIEDGMKDDDREMDSFIENGVEFKSKEVLLKNNGAQFKLKFWQINVDEVPFCCKLCKLAFSSPRKLLSHTYQHNMDKHKASAGNSTVYRCYIGSCEQEFLTAKDLIKHMSGHGLKLSCPYECEKNSLFDDVAQFKEHLTCHRDNNDAYPIDEFYEDDEFVCPWCQMVFTRAEHRKRHQVVHSQKASYECCSCTETFRYQCQLFNHLEDVHKQKKWRNNLAKRLEVSMMDSQAASSSSIVCDWCKSLFFTKENLEQHKKLHTNKTCYTCSYCKKQFKYGCQLKKHYVEKHKKAPEARPEDEVSPLPAPHTCERCGGEFHTQRAYTNHRAMSMKGTFICPICKAVFSWKCSLQHHRVSEHSDAVTVVTEAPAAIIISGTTFSCGWCGRKEPSETAALRHQRQHSKLAAYPCKYCSVVFKHQCQLNNHLEEEHYVRVWPPEPESPGPTEEPRQRRPVGRPPNPASAEIADITSSGSITMATGGRSYSCNWCNQSFNNKKNCIRHQQYMSALAGGYVCEYCSQYHAQYKCQLLEHMLSEHKIPVTKDAYFDRRQLDLKDGVTKSLSREAGKSSTVILRKRRHADSDDGAGEELHAGRRRRLEDVEDENALEEKKASILQEVYDEEEIEEDCGAVEVIVDFDDLDEEDLAQNEHNNELSDGEMAAAQDDDAPQCPQGEAGEMETAVGLSIRHIQAEEEGEAEGTTQQPKVTDDEDGVVAVEAVAVADGDAVDSSPLQCDGCLRDFLFEDELRSHAAGCVSRPLECDFCPETFLLRRDRDAHTCSGGSVRCPQCPRTFFNSHYLYNHVATEHPAGPHAPCTACATGFRFAEQLFHHLDEHHAEEGATVAMVTELACDLCEDRFTTQAELTRHQQEDHRGDAARRCPRRGCGQMLATHAAARRHAKTCRGKAETATAAVGVETVRCADCGVHVVAACLAPHLVMHNRGVRPTVTAGLASHKVKQECPVCRKKVSGAYMKDHLKLHASARDDPEFTKFKGSKMGKQIQCTECGKPVSEIFMQKHRQKYCRGVRLEQVVTPASVVDGKVTCERCERRVDVSYLRRHQLTRCTGKKWPKAEIGDTVNKSKDEMIAKETGKGESEQIPRRSSRRRKKKDVDDDDDELEEDDGIESFYSVEDKDKEAEDEEILLENYEVIMQTDGGSEGDGDSLVGEQVSPRNEDENKRDASDDDDDLRNENMSDENNKETGEECVNRNEISVNDGFVEIVTLQSIMDLEDEDMQMIHIKLEDCEKEETDGSSGNIYAEDECIGDGSENVVNDKAESSNQSDNSNQGKIVDIRLKSEPGDEIVDYFHAKPLVRAKASIVTRSEVNDAGDGTGAGGDEEDVFVAAERGTKPGVYVICPKCKCPYNKLYSQKHLNVCKNKQKEIEARKHLPFACEFCPMKFKTYQLHFTHTQRHTGAIPRNFECDVCTKRFHKNNDLQKHMVTHTGVRPFECSFLCGARFSAKANCVRHERQFCKLREKRK